MSCNRIPNRFFGTIGRGDSDNQIHAGSFHIALHDAGISDYNIQYYSSVLPATAKEVSKSEAKMPPFGSELMTIMATAHGEKGDVISAGIIYAWMYDGKKKVGGLVCEISGKMDMDDLQNKLNISLQELHSRTYWQYRLDAPHLWCYSHTVRKKHGTVLSALCFVDFKTRLI